MDPGTMEERLDRVAGLIQKGFHHQALDLVETLVEASPTDPRVGYAYAVALVCADDLHNALDVLSRTIALDPTHCDALYLLGRVYKSLGDVDKAVHAYRQAISVNPNAVPAFVSLGIVLRSAGRIDEAISCYRRALELEPTSVEALHNLTNALRDAGRLDEARDAHASAAKHRYAAADEVSALGLTMRLEGTQAAAIAAFERAVELAPDAAAAHHNLGMALHEAGRPDDAMPRLRRALELDPELPGLRRNVAALYASMGYTEEAEFLLNQCIERDPDDGVALFRHALLTPVILDSVEQIGSIRARVKERLQARIERPVRTDLAEMFVLYPSFFLSYHGEDNRPLLELQSRAMVAACPELKWEAPHVRHGVRRTGPLRVGFISAHLYAHSVGRTSQGLIKELSGERFRTYVLAIPPARDDQTARLIREHADASVQLPESLDGARRAIADLELDVLYYQDIGMDPGSYVLAHSRLAPVQCASFGHPDTSGIETIDYWVSSDLFETPGSEAHYSERLYCLKGVGNLAYYGRPLLTQSPKSRADFGLDASKHLYLCPQTLFKMHPAFDEVLAEILRQDGDGTVALIASKCSHWVDLLQARFRRTIGPAADRIIFLPQQGGQDFLNLIALADVMLDTVHFNGYNTNLEAFSMGTPVVTMPTTFQRGRHTAGMYRRMGLDDLISKDVADYVAQALRLARDVNYRTEARRRILENCHVLYEDRQFVNEFERFFEFACAEQRHAARTLN